MVGSASLKKSAAVVFDRGDGTDEGDFRLSISRSGIGIELTRPIPMEFVVVSELVWSFPKLKFPVDVSGGIDTFRHRLGRLERLTLELPSDALLAWTGQKLAGLLSAETASVTTTARRRGTSMGIQGGHAALGFDLLADTSDGAVRLFVDQARGVNLPAPAMELALRAVATLLPEPWQRRGARFELRDGAREVLRMLLPERGFRVPATSHARVTVLSEGHGRWVAHFSAQGEDAEPTDEVIAAREWSARTERLDDAIFTGDREIARTRALELLEALPKNGELTARILQMDHAAGGREEGALSFFSPVHLGVDIARAELFRSRGDRIEAIALFLSAAEKEALPSLSSALYLRAAELAQDPTDAVAWLGLASARAPRDREILWSRFVKKLELGRIDTAMADVELIEALDASPRVRFDLWVNAAREFKGRGLDALRLFERALRYRPEDPEALAGLGNELIGAGQARRGIGLLQQSIERSPDSHWATTATLALARALVETLDNPPAAISRLSSLGPRATVDTLALEARLRHELGDLTGASLAYARLRTKIESSYSEERTDPGAARALEEAATFEEKERGDLAGAERHLACALRMDPQNVALRSRYKVVGRLLGGATRAPKPERRPEQHALEPPKLPPQETPSGETPATVGPPNVPEDPAQLDARIEQLTLSLRANPRDRSVILELADCLERGARNHELLALLSAQIEEGTLRAELLPRYRATLLRLADLSDAEGASVEATAFREMAESLR